MSWKAYFSLEQSEKLSLVSFSSTSLFDMCIAMVRQLLSVTDLQDEIWCVVQKVDVLWAQQCRHVSQGMKMISSKKGPQLPNLSWLLCRIKPMAGIFNFSYWTKFFFSPRARGKSEPNSSISLTLWRVIPHTQPGMRNSGWAFSEGFTQPLMSPSMGNWSPSCFPAWKVSIWYLQEITFPFAVCTQGQADRLSSPGQKKGHFPPDIAKGTCQRGLQSWAVWTTPLFSQRLSYARLWPKCNWWRSQGFD